MDAIKDKFRNLSEVEETAGLHENIMSQVQRYRWRWPRRLFAFALAATLVFSLANFSLELINRDIPSLARLAFYDFELSYEHVRDFAVIIASELPIWPLVTLLLNLAIGLAAAAAGNRFLKSRRWLLKQTA